MINKELNILLLNPYTKRYTWELKRAGQPLSLLTIGTYLTKILNVNVKIIDATILGYENDFILPSGKIRYGLSPYEIKNIISLEKPDIVLFSNQFANQYSSMIECSQFIKEISLGILIGVGGVNIEAMPEDVLSNESIDFIFLGEENVLNDFVLALNGRKEFSEINAFGYKKNNKLFINKKKSYVKNLSEIPIYDTDLINSSLYGVTSFHNGISNDKYFDIITERGCPFNCNFCGTGNRIAPYRTFAIGQIEVLLRQLKKNGFNLLLNEDDIGFLDKKRIISLMELYAKFGFKWQQVHGIGPNQIDDELINIMSETGCEKIYFAIETFDEKKRLGFYNKPNSVSDFTIYELISKIEKLSVNGIRTDVGFIIGHPDQSIEDIYKDIRFGKQLKTAGANFVMPWILTLLPGTPFWETLSNYRVGTFDDCNVMTGNIENEFFTPLILRDIQRNAIEYINDISFHSDFLKSGWDSTLYHKKIHVNEHLLIEQNK